jgi:hypothetical protein
LLRISTRGGRMGSSAGAASIHIENAPMVEQTARQRCISNQARKTGLTRFLSNTTRHTSLNLS